MNRLARHWMLTALMLLLLWATAWAGQPSPIDQALESWNGERTLLLRSDLDDPLSSSLVQDLLADLMRRGFSVTPAPLDAKAENGLILDLRPADTATICALSRARDGAIIAFEKQTGAADGPAASPRQKEPHQRDQTCLPPGLNELPGNPVAIALLDAAEGRCEILVLNDKGLDMYTSTDKALKKTAAFPAPETSFRALHLDAADIDGKGGKEIAVVWAEDEKTIYEGADSRLHSWILHYTDDGFLRASHDLKSYLRLIGSNGYLQHRGRNAPFADKIYTLSKNDGTFSQGRPIDWPEEANIYTLTPVRDNQGLLLNDENRMTIIDLDDERPSPRAHLLETLGEFQGPQVAVRLKETEYRLGFEKEGQVNTSYHPVPRRISLSSASQVVTVRRGRSEGLPLVSQPSGEDALVEITTSPSGLNMQTPFAPVPFFLHDFALLPATPRPAALLLLNEKADGSGTGYLLHQTAE